MEKLSKFLEMKLKRTPHQSKIHFRENQIKFCIIFKMISFTQHLGLSKDQASMFKYFVIN